MMRWMRCSIERRTSESHTREGRAHGLANLRRSTYCRYTHAATEASPARWHPHIRGEPGAAKHGSRGRAGK
eukprot:scaffold7155_cov138-Isochrysis_galbana.AAC.2